MSRKPTIAVVRPESDRMTGPLDNDGDSQMQSSNSASSDDITNDLFPDADKPTTPIAQTGFPHLAELSPPNSQGVPLLGTSAAAAAMMGANVNGKRPLSTIDNSNNSSSGEALPALPSLRGGGQTGSTASAQVKTHTQSGYSWTKQEDEPGYLWKNKRAVEDANRAWDSLVLKDKRVGSECNLVLAGHIEHTNKRRSIWRPI